MVEEKSFVNREEELKELNHYMEKVKSGNGEFIIFKGEAGVGKTLLAENFIEECKERGFDIYRGRCLYHESSDPFLPFYDLFEDHIQEDDSLRDNDGTPSKSSIGLMGIQEDGSEKQDISISDRRERFFNKITTLVHRLAKEKPILIFLDDLHSIDESSSFLLHHVVRNTKNSRVLILGAYRPEELKVKDTELPFEIALRRMMEEKLAKIMDISRLDFDDISRLVKNYLNREELPESFSWTLYRESEGNPYYVLEILNSMIDEDIIDINSFTIDLEKKLQDIEIPSSIKNIADRRINSLEKDQRKVLMYASIIGNEFNFELLENVIKMDVIDLLDILDELIDKGIIKEKENTSDEIYRFNHVQTRTSIYDDMGKSRKRIMHSMVAEGMEDIYGDRIEEFYYELSRHLYKGKKYKKAYKYSKKAGDQSISALAVATAIDYYERALKALEQSDDIENKKEKRLDLLISIGEHSFEISKWEKSMKTWKKVLNICRELDKNQIEVDSLIKIGTIHKEFNEYDQSRKILEDSLSISKEIDYDYGKAKANLKLGYLHWRLGEHDDAMEHYKIGIKFAKKIEAEKLLAEAYIDMGNIYTHKSDIEKAIEYDKKSLEILKTYDASENLGRVYNNIGDLYMKNKEWTESIDYFRKTIETGKKIDNKKIIGYGYFNLAEALANIEEVEDAFHNAKRAEEILGKINNHSGLAATYRVLGTIYRLKDELDKAEEYLEKSQEMFKDPDIPFDRAQGKIELGHIYEERNENQKAIEYLEEAKEILDDLEASQFVDEVEEELQEIKS